MTSQADSAAAHSPAESSAVTAPAPTPATPRPARPRPWPIAWYPLAVPVAFIVSIWAESLIHPVWLLRPLVVTVVAVVGLTLALSLLTGDRDRGALAAWALVVALLIDDLRITVLLIGFSLLVLAVGLAGRGRPWRLGPTVSRALSALGAALLAVTAVSAVQRGAVGSAIDDVRLDLARPAPATAYGPASPDIWVILLDGYPGEDAAADLAPDWDRDAFPSALEARGFEVQRHSETNYPLTRLVLPAMFEARHLADWPDLDPPFISPPDDARRLRHAGDDSVVLRALAAAGYERIFISSGWAHIGWRRVDRVVDPDGPDEFETGLLRAAGIGRLLDIVDPTLVEDWHRGRIADTLSRTGGLAEEARDGRPRFVFVHLPAPHPPLVFGSDGTPRNGGPGAALSGRYDGGILREDRIRRTFENADHVGQLAVATIDRIIAASSRPPVIVVFSDHGSEIGWNDLDPLGSDLVERMSNMLAVHAPGHAGLFPPGTTPVNVFPLVLNAYLATDLALQPNSHWAWPTGGSELDLVELDPATWRPK